MDNSPDMQKRDPWQRFNLSGTYVYENFTTDPGCGHVRRAETINQPCPFCLDYGEAHALHAELDDR